jgi:hypothetical protein
LRLRAKHRWIGGLLARTAPPHSTRAWERGAVGEEVLGARLDTHASDTIAVLHDRRIRGSRANIDHLVITTGGVFVVDAKHYDGKRPARRSEGGLLRRRVEKLIVGGRDRTALVDGVLGQVDRVRSVLDDDGIEVTGMLCFVDADWPKFGAFFSIAGVQVVSPRRLGKILRRTTGDVDVRAVRDRLALGFPSA